ncbi:MAG: tetratricopeptide repeat protein, partial [Bacteroidia bacterium]
NIGVCEAVAWVKYKEGDYKTANAMINKSLRTNCQNPALLCHAGLIKIKAGEKEKGIELIKKAFANNPFISDLDLKNEASKYLINS